MNTLVILVTALIAAVLTGALLIGNSMRGSLRELAEKRRGNIDTVIRTGRFLTGPIPVPLPAGSPWENIEPGIILDGTIQLPDSVSKNSSDHHNTSGSSLGVTIVGVTDSFWLSWYKNKPESLPSRWGKGKVAINRDLANSLALTESSRAFLVFVRPEQIPADSVFGRKEDLPPRRQIDISEIVENKDGPGLFSLENNQATPRQVFVPLADLQRYLTQTTNSVPSSRRRIDSTVNHHPSGGEYNALFCLNTATVEPVSAASALEYFRKTKFFPLDDLGISTDSQTVTTGRSSFEFLYLKAREFFFSQQMTKKVQGELQQISLPPNAVSFTTSSYLANSIERIGADKTERTPKRSSVPYSVVAGIDWKAIQNNASLASYLFDQEHFPKDKIAQKNGIVVTSFLADELALTIGDTVRLTCFEPESDHSVPTEKSVTLTVTGILNNTQGFDRHLVPDAPGLTDAETLADWNPPFPFDIKRIQPQDEQFWKDHHTAPKAFVSLETAQSIWGSRFGFTSAFCIAFPSDPNKKESLETTSADTLNQIVHSLESSISPALGGLAPLPIKEMARKASAGSTPFDVLFLCFSFFMIVSVLLLVGMLAKISLELKYSQAGLLLAMGFTRQKVFRILLLLTCFPVVIGAILGLFPAVLYARLMIFGLTTRWVGAIGVPFIEYHSQPSSFVFGVLGTIFLALITVAFAFREIRHTSLLALLQEAPSLPTLTRQKHRRKLFPFTAFILFGVGLALVVIGKEITDQQMKTGLFFASGGMFLFSLILCFYLFMIKRSVILQHNGLSFRQLVFFSLARRPGRSSLTVALLTGSLFIVLAVGIFRLDPPDSNRWDESGHLITARPDGGFVFVTETRLPFFNRLENADDFEQIFREDADAQQMEKSGVRFYPLRTRPGQKVGCSNLYRIRNNLRIIGLSNKLIERGGFLWSGILDDKMYNTSVHYDTGSELESLQKKKQHLEKEPDVTQNPFLLLRWEFAPARELNSEGAPLIPVVPIVLDKNTAMYSLEIYQTGKYLPLQNERGERIDGLVVGFLSQSLFQSEVLMSEENLLRYFPEITGYRFLLTEMVHQPKEAVKTAGADSTPLTVSSLKHLADRSLAEFGPSSEKSESLLARFYSVQNGYIMIFQTLGMLGVLLGTLGLAGLQVRSILERRFELALLCAFGFSGKRIAFLLFCEGLIPFFVAIFIATLTAALAVFPQMEMESFGIGTLGIFCHGLRSFGPAVFAIFIAGLLANMTGLFIIGRNSITESLKC